jgi:flagellin
VEKSAEVAFQAAVAGTDSYDVITVDFGNLSTDMSALRSTGLSTQTSSQSAIDVVDSALTSVNEQRAEFGAATNRLEYAVDNMTNIQNNAEASRSRIMDTDYAETTSELAKAQIIAQAGTAMLAQANQSSQSVLSLLR